MFNQHYSSNSQSFNCVTNFHAMKCHENAELNRYDILSFISEYIFKNFLASKICLFLVSFDFESRQYMSVATELQISMIMCYENEDILTFIGQRENEII